MGIRTCVLHYRPWQKQHGRLAGSLDSEKLACALPQKATVRSVSCQSALPTTTSHFKWGSLWRFLPESPLFHNKTLSRRFHQVFISKVHNQDQYRSIRQKAQIFITTHVRRLSLIVTVYGYHLQMINNTFFFIIYNISSINLLCFLLISSFQKIIVDKHHQPLHMIIFSFLYSW